MVGQLIGQAARFYLFRRYVFRKPVPVNELGQHAPWPDQDAREADLRDTEDPRPETRSGSDRI